MRKHPSIRLDHAAAEAGITPVDLMNHVLAGRLRPVMDGHGLEYRQIITEVEFHDGTTGRLVQPPHHVPEGDSPTVPPGLYPLSVEVVRRALGGRSRVAALQDSDGDLFRLAEPLNIDVTDVLLDRAEWESFKKEHREGLRGTPATGDGQLSERESPGRGTSSAPGTSKRDTERLGLGADALITLRRAAELLPGSDKENRSVIDAAGLVRKHSKRQLVRWGDVVELFQTDGRLADLDEAGIQPPTKPRGRSRRPRGVGLRLADLDS